MCSSDLRNPGQHPVEAQPVGGEPYVECGHAGHRCGMGRDFPAGVDGQGACGGGSGSEEKERYPHGPVYAADIQGGAHIGEYGHDERQGALPAVGYGRVAYFTQPHEHDYRCQRNHGGDKEHAQGRDKAGAFRCFGKGRNP